MIEKITTLQKEIESYELSTAGDAEAFRLKYLSRKGLIPELFETLKSVPKEEKKEVGRLLNILKQTAEARHKEFAGSSSGNASAADARDLTLPPVKNTLGNFHPLTLTRYRIIEIFERLGFSVADGPEIEDDWHNFSALNFPENHPAREMQDTFFVSRNPDILLRTHTSNVQIRLLEQTRPPVRAIMPGRVYRNEAISARAHCFFHQVEGLYIDENVSFADLKQTLLYFAKEMFGVDSKIRLRPSYFPFTEPSAEMDVSCSICKGSGCNVCKYTGWLEILGCGMVDPSVLENCEIDSKKYTGFAFGMGIERIAMLKYDIKDLRLFSENDIRFLRQFKGEI